MSGTCAVSCQVNDQQNQPVKGAVVSAILSAVDVHHGYVAPTSVEAITDEDGKAVLNLWPNQLGAVSTFYRIRITTPTGRVLRTNAVVPDAPTAQLHQIAELPPFEGKSLPRVALDEVVKTAVIVEEKTATAIESLNASIASAQATAVALATATDAAGQPTDPATVQQIIQNLRGPAGPKGDRGLAGSAGPKGEKGDKGEKGEKGDPGTGGGGAGTVGPMGPQGPKGEKGDRGETGPQGDPGETGPQGFQGLAGPEGPQGERGAEGPIGPRGLQGIPGLNGATGPRGEVGPMGPRGDMGPQGPQGAAGEVGPRGEKGDKGDRGDVGLQGIQGLRGLTGATGEQGPQGLIGPKGDKGDTGIQGIQGVQGPKGDTGAQGERGLIGPKGDAGAKGDTGSVGPQGERGQDGITGAKGDKGDKGDTGDAGATGPKGDRGEKGEPGVASSDMSRKLFHWARPQGLTTTVNVNNISLSAIGAVSGASHNTVNLHQFTKRVNYQVTTASASAVAGIRNVLNQWCIGSGGKIGGFKFTARFGPSTGNAANATRRGFFGMSSLASSALDSDPSSFFPNALGVGCDSTDANYQIIHRTNIGVATKVDTGISKSAADATEIYELTIECASGGAVNFTFTNLNTDQSFTHSASANLPVALTLLSPHLVYSVGGTSSVIGLAFMGMYIESEY